MLRRATAIGAGAIGAGAIGAGAIGATFSLAEPKSRPTQVATQNIVLRDGRRLAFHTDGDPQGTPVYAFHGMGSSHLTWGLKSGASISEVCPGVRLIALDRPGYGDSSPPPAGYSYTQFADDVCQLADALGTPTYCVAGHSSGGPYALAAAAQHPDRVLACAAISSDPPYAHPHAPEAVRAADADFGHKLYGRDPVTKFGKWRASALESGAATKAHAWKSGVVGFVTDFSLERLPWSFRLEDIRLADRLTIWVGDKDEQAMVVGAPWMKSLIPGSRLRVVPGGHGFKSEPQHLEAILTELREQYAAAVAGR